MIKTHPRLAIVFSVLALVAALAACAGGTGSLPQSGPGMVPGARTQHSIPVIVVPKWMHERRPHSLRALGPRHVFLRRDAFTPRLRAAAPTPTPTATPQQNNMTYNQAGAPVQTTPSVYIIFWGFNFNTTKPPFSDATHDPDGLATYLYNFVSTVDCSEWFNTMSQYSMTEPTTYVSPCTTFFKGVFVDSVGPSTTYTQTQVGTEAATIAYNYGKIDQNTNFIVVTPAGTAENDGGNFCAYHSFTDVSSKFQPYTLLPYVPDNGTSCGANLVNASGTLDGVSINAGHEIAETITDPLINAWYDTSYTAPYCYNSRLCEIGDKCSWWGLQNTHFGGDSIGINEFPTQPLWSNVNSACVQSYGTLPTPSPSASPTPPPFGPVRTNPKALRFASAKLPAKKIVVTQARFTGKFKRTGCFGFATFATVTNAHGRATFTVTPNRAGQCNTTLKGGGGASATLHVTIE